MNEPPKRATEAFRALQERSPEAAELMQDVINDAVAEAMAPMDAALTKINAIRISIVGAQSINWSEHIYPLVAALNEAGYECPPYDVAKQNVGTLIERCNAAEARAEKAERELAELQQENRSLLARLKQHNL